MNRLKKMFAIFLSANLILASSVFPSYGLDKKEKTIFDDLSFEYEAAFENIGFNKSFEPELVEDEPDVTKVENELVEEEKEEAEDIYKFEASEYEIELLALVTMAEAEGESDEGKRLVIDTILNRVDSGYFPDTIEGVIYQSGQFSSMWNGRVDRCYVRDDICELVREELQSRVDYDVIFFTAGGYGYYGTPMYSVGNHYFSSY